AEVKQMAGNGLAIVAGVGLSENHHVGVIGRGVKTYCEPQTPCASQRQAPKKAVKSNADRVDPVFMRFKEEVEEPEDRREENCCRPEANSLGQRFERIAPKQKFFRRAQSEHRRSPCSRVKKKLPNRQRQAIKSAPARQINRSQNQRGWDES